MLTIAYITSRLDPKIEWFFDSLHRETGGDYADIRILVIDFWAHENWRCPINPPGFSGPSTVDRSVFMLSRLRAPPSVFDHIPPKPTVWQGRHRVTRDNWFAASNTRNTAILYAQPGWIAFVDDLSVLMPGWLGAVRAGMANVKPPPPRYRRRPAVEARNPAIVMGAYKKMKALRVKDGLVASCEEFPNGVDSRWPSGRDGQAVRMNGSCMFGCSLAAPVEAFLEINGFDERCDGLGSEDYIAGIMLENSGYAFVYDRRMLTYESEELHHYVRQADDDRQHPWQDTENGRVLIASPLGIPCSFRREDKGKSPRDKSHAILAFANGAKRSGNEFDLRAWRDHLVPCHELPPPSGPKTDWYDSQPIAEM